MDTPKRAVSWLESFPPDIWAYVVWYLPGEQLGRLMMTGALLLRQRLKSPQVVKSIKLGVDFIKFKSFPMFLNDFPSVDELMIHSVNLECSQVLSLTMALIPSGVRKLQLSGSWENVATKLFGGIDGTFNLAKHLPHLQCLDCDRFILADHSWTNHYPQSLTKLSLGGWDGTVELPSTLIHAEFDNVSLSIPSFVSKLPTSLESFIVKTALHGVDLLLPLLPPLIRQLSLGLQVQSSAGPLARPNFLEQLPKFLTSFQFPRCVEIDLESRPELISLLPSTLTELSIKTPFPCSAWPFLPPNLKELTFESPYMSTMTSKIIDTHGVHHEVPSIPFGTLPRSLTKLVSVVLYLDDHSFCGPPSRSDQSSIESTIPYYFPPQLTYLSIAGVLLARETSQLLPPSLTHLEIGSLCEHVCEHLPAGLKTLTSDKTLVSPKLFNLLPKSLSDLRLDIVNSQDSWFDCNTGEMIDPISNLPEYSIHEMCLSKSFDWKNTSLPPSLTVFQMPMANQLGDSFLLHQKLPNLVKLNLGESRHFTDLSIPLLSPHLTTLNLRSSSQISGKSFVLLPRCLTHLDLSLSDEIFDSDIQHLPRTLKSARLNRAIHLTDICIPDLPRHLESLSLRRSPLVTPACYPNLPYPLRSFQLMNPVECHSWRILYGKIFATNSSITFPAQ